MSKTTNEYLKNINFAGGTINWISGAYSGETINSISILEDDITVTLIIDKDDNDITSKLNPQDGTFKKGQVITDSSTEIKSFTTSGQCQLNKTLTK